MFRTLEELLLDQAMSKVTGDGSIYVISDGELFKFGQTNGDPMKRLKALQTGNGRKLSLYASAPCPALEQVSHRELAEDRRAGEWFRITTQTIQWANAIKAYDRWLKDRGPLVDARERMVACLAAPSENCYCREEDGACGCDDWRAEYEFDLLALEARLARIDAHGRDACRVIAEALLAAEELDQ